MVRRVAPPVGTACVGHGCGGPPAVWEQQIAALVYIWAGFSTLGTGGCTLGGRRSSHFFLFAMLGGRQLFIGGVYGPVGERVFQTLKIMDLVT